MSETEAPIEHPGQRLVEDFLEPMCLSPTRVARAIGVPARLLLDLVHHRARRRDGARIRREIQPWRGKIAARDATPEAPDTLGGKHA